MASRPVVPVSATDLDDLPDRCRVCLFWELGRPRPDARHHAEDELAGDPATQKQAWWSSLALEDAPPGRIVRVDDELAAYALFAPPGVIASRRAPAPKVSDDALLLATIWVEPTMRERGIGRQLVQAAIKEALRRDLAAVEVYGDRRFHEEECVLPAMWLLREGFEVHREHPRYPLFRLETKRTVRWADTLEHKLDDIWAAIPKRVNVPVPSPESGGRAPAPAPQRSVTREPRTRA